MAVDAAELTMVHYCQGDESQSHPKKIEEEWRGVLKSVLNENEGCSPNDDDR
jgi:hypothetical protein